jgi:hypothetical protein
MRTFWASTIRRPLHCGIDGPVESVSTPADMKTGESHDHVM